MSTTVIIALIVLVAIVVVVALIIKPEWREGVVEFFADVIESFGDD